MLYEVPVDAEARRANALEIIRIAREISQPPVIIEELPFDCQSGKEISMTMNDTNVWGATASTTGANVDLVTQNLNFMDQADKYLFDMSGSDDPTRKLIDTDDTDLGEFFRRPVKIDTLFWGTGTVLYEEFDPWSVFIANKRVANRMSNFNLMRAKLHLKFVINGNGFLYGRALVSYLPLPDFDDLSRNRALVSADLVAASQRPHIYLDPTTSNGGEMVLPFFWMQNSVALPGNSGFNYSQLGALNVREINTLKHANGAVDSVTISVFAWLEDIELSVPTSTDIVGLTPQSGTEVDEANAKGVISKPASAIAKCASMFMNMPTIGPFAMATAMASQSISDIAKMFGYSRPIMTKQPEPLIPKTLGHFAVTNVPDTSNKLSVDEKQELTIDPRIAGVGGEDPLTIRSIACRESYITSFDWAIGTFPENLLWNTRVTPVIWREAVVGETTEYHFPPCAMAAIPFRYWTGTMRYRFQVVASTFHKGRLKFVYDPNFLDSTPEYNVNYITVVDISQTRDFTLEIGNGQPITLLSHDLPGLDVESEIFSTSRYTSSSFGSNNGVLGVYVVNELTVPNSTVDNDIQINVFVSAGDDFEVFVPTSYYQKFVYQPQSGEEVPESMATSEPSAPVHTQFISLGPGRQDLSEVNKVFAGEAITSFRQLLKRFQLHTGIGNDTNGARLVSLQQSMFPYLRGNVAGAIGTSAGGPYNYCNTMLFHWVTLCFQGMRGSTRWKVVPRFTNSNPYTIKAQRTLSRSTGASLGYSLDNSALLGDSAGSPRQCVANELSDDPTLGQTIGGYPGMAFTHSYVNPTLEYEIPYYDDLRFFPGKQENWTSNYNSGQTIQIAKNFAIGDSFEFYFAVGEDFQTYFWTGCPPLYFENVVPALGP